MHHSSNQRHADIVIIGAGAAGLSLAVALARSPLNHKRVVLLDSKAEFRHDRTWCYWALEDHPFRSAEKHRWHQWRIHTPERAINCQSNRYPYVHLPSYAMYRHAQTIIEGQPSFDLHLGVEVKGCTEQGGHVDIDSSEGTWRASHVFDSRPSPRATNTSLKQHFLGWVIHTGKAVFDPSTVTLMDFRVPQTQGVHFMYLLPFSATTALVEDTYFSNQTLATEVYEQALRSYLNTHYACDYVITHREQGVIPMDTRVAHSRAPSSRIVSIGMAAGVAKPSTGYAFTFMQRHGAAICEALTREPWRAPPVRAQRWIELDGILLNQLRVAPEQGAKIFARLFDRVPNESMLRFLSEQASTRDILKVMRSVPRLSFMQTALRSLLSP